MYKKHFGFSEKPFSIIPNPNFLYLSPKHKNALTYMEYGIMERLGFVLLTGEIGIGKTTLIRHLLNQVEDQLDIGVIFNTNIQADQLILLFMREFEITPISKDKTKNIETIYQFLLRKYAEGRKVLLIVDEAQNLNDEVLEEIRMLSNFHSDDEIFLQIMLVGQPELRTKINKPELKQLRQRIAASYHLSALNLPEVKEYIRVRLIKAGCSKEIFLPKTIERIFEVSCGIPRTINILCDTALVFAYGNGAYKIGTNIIEQVVEVNAGLFEPTQPYEKPADKIETTPLEEQLATLEKKFSELNFKVLRKLDEIQQKFSHDQNDMLVKKLTAQLKDERSISDGFLQELTTIKNQFS